VRTVRVTGLSVTTGNFPEPAVVRGVRVLDPTTAMDRPPVSRVENNESDHRFDVFRIQHGRQRREMSLWNAHRPVTMNE
jgi:hypothetical protein